MIFKISSKMRQIILYIFFKLCEYALGYIISLKIIKSDNIEIYFIKIFLFLNSNCNLQTELVQTSFAEYF